MTPIAARVREGICSQRVSTSAKAGSVSRSRANAAPGRSFRSSQLVGGQLVTTESVGFYKPRVAGSNPAGGFFDSIQRNPSAGRIAACLHGFATSHTPWNNPFANVGMTVESAETFRGQLPRIDPAAASWPSVAEFRTGPERFRPGPPAEPPCAQVPRQSR